MGLPPFNLMSLWLRSLLLGYSTNFGFPLVQISGVGDSVPHPANVPKNQLRRKQEKKPLTVVATYSLSMVQTAEVYIQIEVTKQTGLNCTAGSQSLHTKNRDFLRHWEIQCNQYYDQKKHYCCS